MKARPILLLLVSAVLGVVAIALLRGLIQPSTSGAVAMSTKRIVVSRTTLKFGDGLTSTNLREVDFPTAAIPDGTFGSIDALTKGEPRVVLETIRAGEPVLSQQVTGSGGKASLSSVIDPTMRAVSIRVDDVSGTAGFITPSDRVDVMLTCVQAPEPSQTDVLLQDIKVLAVDQEANERKDKPTVVKAVTLEVTPDEAQKISLARSVGTLSLSLRNLTNGNHVTTHSISARDLPGAPSKPSPTAPRKIEIIRGSKGTTYEISPKTTETDAADQLPNVAAMR